MTIRSCNFCRKEGVLLYPVRYAVACPAGAQGATGLSGNFKIENGPASIAPAKYALRAIRSGYLYTYDEKRSRLKAYLVLPGGQLWNFPLDLPPPTLENKKLFCSDPLEITMSRFVDVAHSAADPAQLFWMGWSNSAWTPALIGQVKDARWRQKHMRKIDVHALMAGRSVDHTASFATYPGAVSHFSMTATAMHKAFDFSNTPVELEVKQAGTLKDMMVALAGKMLTSYAFIAALDDPVGITNDLSELTVPTEHSGFDPEFYRGRIIEEILVSLEAAVRQRAGQEWRADMQQRQFDEDHPVIDGLSPTAAKDTLSLATVDGRARLARRAAEEKKMSCDHKEDERLAAENYAWKQLTTNGDKPILDEKKRKAFPARYEAAIRAYEPKAQAIAAIHVAWLTSKQLANWMDGVHDPANLASGFAYRESMAQCLGKAVTTKACDEQLTRWMQTPDVANVANLYARAMLFNQTEIVSAAGPQVRGSDLKLKYLLSIYKNALKLLGKGQEQGLGDRLIFTTANSTIRALTQGGSAVMCNLALINLSLLGKTAIVASNLSRRDVADWIIAQARQQGIKLDTGLIETRANATQAAAKAPVTPPPRPGVVAYELDVEQLRQEGRIAPGALKSVKIPGFDLSKQWLNSSVDFNTGAVAVILQLVALNFVVQDFKNSDMFDRGKYAVKLGIAVTSLSGSMMEMVGTSMEKAPHHPLSVAIKRHWASGEGLGQRLITRGKILAAAAGLVTAAFDFFEAIKAFYIGQNLLGSMYLASGAVGVWLAVAAYNTALIYWPVFIAAIFIAIAIALIRNSALKGWLTHCMFSADEKGNKYPSLKEELEALQSAMGV